MGQISFFTPLPCLRLATNAATATADGYGPGDHIPFTPVGLVLPAPAPAPPGVSGLVGGGNGWELTATNLALGYGYTVEASTNLLAWTSAATFWATNTSQPVPLPPDTNSPAQFYRLSCP